LLIHSSIRPRRSLASLDMAGLNSFIGNYLLSSLAK
jgi:hypothetical protein